MPASSPELSSILASSSSLIGGGFGLIRWLKRKCPKSWIDLSVQPRFGDPSFFCSSNVSYQFVQSTPGPGS